MRRTMLDKREELTQELRRARGWILAVGIILPVAVFQTQIASFLLHDSSQGPVVLFATITGAGRISGLRRTPPIADRPLRHPADPSSLCLKSAGFTIATNDARRSARRR
jgi:hypothetical protein